LTLIDTRTADNILDVAFIDGKSRVQRSLAVPPVRFVQPKGEGDAAWVFVSAFGGGMLEGDDYRFDITCRKNATLIFSPQANTRIFPCPNGKTTRQAIRGTICADGLVVVGGDPVVPYGQSRFTQNQRWTLHSGARLVLMDWWVAGRLDRGEKFAFEDFQSDLRIENEKGQPLLLDRLSISSEDAGMGGFCCNLVIHVLGPNWESLKTGLEEWLRQTIGETRQQKWMSEEMLAGIGIREGTGFSVRALGKERSSLEPLVNQLFNLLGSPEWLGFNPWTRKY